MFLPHQCHTASHPNDDRAPAGTIHTSSAPRSGRSRLVVFLFALLIGAGLHFSNVQFVAAQGEVNIASNQASIVLTPRQDTYISNTAPDNNFASATSLIVQREDLIAVIVQEAFFQFDLADLPPGASIQQAELRLYQRAATGNRPLRIDRVLAPWVASATTWNQSPATADYYGPVTPSLAMDTYIAFDVTELVEAWHNDNANFPNHGLKLRFDTDPLVSSYREFYSMEGENPPQLQIVYTPQEIVIPGNAVSDPLEPNCAVNNSRYKDGANYSFFGTDGSLSGIVQMIHDGNLLYVCIADTGTAADSLRVYLDTNRTETPPSVPMADQIALEIFVQDGTLVAWQGTGNPQTPYAPITLAGWNAVAAEPPVSVGRISAEFAIDLAALGVGGQCGADFGIAAYHHAGTGGPVHGWPRSAGPNDPSTWTDARLQGVVCPIRVVCSENNEPCGPAAGIEVFDAVRGTRFAVDADGYVLPEDRATIPDGASIWARQHITDVFIPIPQSSVYHTSGPPQVVNLAAFAGDPPGVMLLRISPDQPLLTVDVNVSAQWRVEDNPAYVRWLRANLAAASQFLYRYSHAQVALGKITIQQDAAGWTEADLRLHAHNFMRPNAILGGITATPLADPDNDQLPAEIEGEIIYWPGSIRIGAAWNRYNLPTPAGGFPVDVSQDWAMVLAHEFGHYLLFLRDTYFRIGPNDTIVNVYSCTGSAMGWVYFPENHGFVGDPTHWTDNCRATYGNDLLNRHEWATITRFYPWLKPPTLDTPLSTANLPAGITQIELIPASGESPGVPTQSIELAYQDSETASSVARGFIFRNDRIIDQGGPVAGTTSLELVGSQVGDRLCLIDIHVATESEADLRHQFGCDVLTPGNNTLLLRKETGWAPVIALSPVNTLTMEIEIIQAVDVPLVARLYPEDGVGFVEAALEVQPGPLPIVRGTFSYSQPIMSGFVHIFADETSMPGLPRREALIDYGANGGGLPGPTSSFGHAPVVASADGRAVFLLKSGITLGPGEFIAWQSMLGRPPVPSSQTIVSSAYRLIALPPEIVNAGVVSIRYPASEISSGLATASTSLPQVSPAQAAETLALHFWTGANWQQLATDFVTDPNGDLVASAASQGIGVYALMTKAAPPTPALYIPSAMR